MTNVQSISTAIVKELIQIPQVKGAILCIEIHWLQKVRPPRPIKQNSKIYSRYKMPSFFLLFSCLLSLHHQIMDSYLLSQLPCLHYSEQEIGCHLQQGGLADQGLVGLPLAGTWH